MHEFFQIPLLVSYCLRITWLPNTFNSQVSCYNNSFQHRNILVDLMEHNLVTIFYHVNQHSPDMHMEPKNWHNCLFQDLDLPCNDNVKE